MTFTKKHNPGCGCCECEGVPLELYYRKPDGEDDYVRTKYFSYYGRSGFRDYETYDSTWNELSGTWTKRYYQTVEDAKYPRDPDEPLGLMTESDDALLIYKPLDQNHQRSVVTVQAPWSNDYRPNDYATNTQFCDFEIVLICAYQDANNYLYAKLRIRRRTDVGWIFSDPEVKKGNDKYSEIEFYERSAGSDMRIGDTRYWYTDEGPDGSLDNYIAAGLPITLEWCYTPETYENDGKMAVTVYQSSRSDERFNGTFWNAGTNLFDFKDYFTYFYRSQGASQQGHWSFTQEMNGTGTQVGFGTGTIHVAPDDTELTARKTNSWPNYGAYNKGPVFENFGNYLHNKENGACPKCQEGCVPHTTGVGIRQQWSDGNLHVRRARNAEYIYKYQYEKIPSTNDDLNFDNFHPAVEEYAVIKANNADTKWISYHEVKHAKNHNYSLRFFLAFDEDDDDLTDNDYEISLVFDYKDYHNYHRLKCTATLVFPTDSAFAGFEQTDVTLQLYKVTGGSESAVGDAITATLNHQYIHLVVCTLTDQIQVGLGEQDHEWERFADSDGILHTEMISTTLHDGKRFGFETGISPVEDDNQIQSPLMAVMERRKWCRECSKTICEGCGNAPAFYKVVIEWGRQYKTWDTQAYRWVQRFDTNIPDGCDRYSCQVTSGTYLATKTSDCVYEFENDNVKFWLKLNRARWSNLLNADVQVWRKSFVDNPEGKKYNIASEPNVEGLTARWHEGGTYVADCGLPHEFVIYTSSYGWWNHPNTCQIMCPAPFQSWPFGYRIKVIRE
jgi:hypothetical protein